VHRADAPKRMPTLYYLGGRIENIFCVLLNDFCFIIVLF
jgi:hypothetical protein